MSGLAAAVIAFSVAAFFAAGALVWGLLHPVSEPERGDLYEHYDPLEDFDPLDHSER